MVARLFMILTPLCILAASASGCNGKEVIADITYPSDEDSDGSDGFDETISNGDSESGDSENGDSEDGDSEDGDSEEAGLDCGDYALKKVDEWGNPLGFYLDHESDVRELTGVTEVLGSLVIRGLDASKVDLSSLKDIRCIRGEFSVFMSNLRDLDVFSNLRYVHRNIEIVGNNDMRDLSGLGNLKSVEGNVLKIYANQELPNCAAREVYDTVVALGWQGQTCIRDNAPDSCEDIEFGCGNEDHFWK